MKCLSVASLTSLSTNVRKRLCKLGTFGQYNRKLELCAHKKKHTRLTYHCHQSPKHKIFSASLNHYKGNKFRATKTLRSNQSRAKSMAVWLPMLSIAIIVSYLLLKNVLKKIKYQMHWAVKEAMIKASRNNIKWRTNTKALRSRWNKFKSVMRRRRPHPTNGASTVNQRDPTTQVAQERATNNKSLKIPKIKFQARLN